MTSLKNQAEGPPQTRKQAVAEPSPSRVVPKPVPQTQAQDPKRYQIEQLRRRYSPKESNAPHGATSFVFKLVPSDPDFPFELAHLECDIRVPQDYPDEKPVLFVKNTDIPRGFGINIEKGWERLLEEKPGATLLALTRELDKNLERFLSEQKAETVKLVNFKDTRHIAAQAAEAAAAPVTPVEPVETAKPAPLPYVPEPSYTKDQIAAAKARRATEVRQLEARMGRMPLYRRSPDGIVYTLPIEPKRRSELPPGLQGILTLHLIIPLIYPLQNLRVQLNEADSEIAEPLEDIFSEKAAEQHQMTLMSHLNYLAQNLHKLAKQAQAQVQARAQAEAAKAEELKAMAARQEVARDGNGQPGPSGEKSHIQVIARPPEWGLVYGEDDSTEEDTDPEDNGQGGAALGGEPTEAAPVVSDTPERGTMMSFPSIELHGVEIMQVSILSLSIKCERCKTVNEAGGLKPDVEKSLSCKKCTSPMAVTFRATLIHEHSSRAGFLDLSGCKVADMLPSTFTPTCARCSTASLGLVSVRGETVTNICRDCHAKFTFKIPEVKFLFITPGTLPPPTTGPRRKQEKLGLHAGEPLANKGACQHYRKSYRWFRFSCCSRVHPCDKCHDDAEDHVNEWANRMICGWCSREQNYAVEACGYCGRSVIGRKGKGFWEGGRGTRDHRLMSRKDPRKHKRIGGSQAAKKE
ncbi:hypothetical protein EDB81DRAFT_343114 [Dactylonectria macrodidyma]|uniref:CHY-type domain-containing protein n=1 Tax=Dactylonectria macrodidyma TaxID=307937 RepID=A0A9P9JH70_9HYPO|nr:hypothetical protein EDB81DRAFT_343114 [Dactylonectria macrodidyma]